ncbi:MAG: manganese efflux pump MntP family protein [Spirochaetes bacterium]|jgi:putative Mn2+ efflux pump MntP|nr:manganese efflux pump MntP family protein [Spirochaetota bacterium]
MSFVSIIAIAIALSIDALSVSIANGIIIKDLKIKHAFLISFSFGLFQAFMPVIGWLAGIALIAYIQQWDHWIAFILLSGVAIKMIYDARGAEDGKVCKNCLDPKVLLIMSFATSIDALAIGISFSVLNIDIILPVLLIGLVTFINCLAGIFLANRIANIFGRRIEYAGGAILIIIATKILVDHLYKGI